MNRLLLTVLIAVSANCRAGVLLSVSPSDQTVTLGSQASFDVDTSGLGGGTALGVYDLNFAFDSTLLSYSTISFGNQLDLFGLGDIQSVTPGSGTVEVFELSLESVSDLNTLQASSFTLFMLVFDTLSLGSDSPVTLSINSLGDASGNSVPANLENGAISVSAPSAVPEASTFSSLLGGLLGLGIMRRKAFRCSSRRVSPAVLRSRLIATAHATISSNRRKSDR